jgi:hypothetical protein
MNFLDANVFLRYLVRSPDPKNEERTKSVGFAIQDHRLGIPLATFDRALLKLPIVTPWQPAGNGQT